MLRSLSRILDKEGYKTQTVTDGQEAIRQFDSSSFDLVITDMRMPNADGFAVLQHVKGVSPETPVIMLSAYGSIPNAVQAMRQGAFDYISKPVTEKKLITDVVERALCIGAQERLAPILKANRPDPHNFALWRKEFAHEVIGDSSKLLEALMIASQVADADCPVLISGESGTGKELIARALHRANTRSKGPFVAINCPAIPKELVESELFGHAKGAFTGATVARIGRFAAADKGTLFLDEIGEMDLSIQSKLLRVLQDYKITRVGESHCQKVDVRIIAATNRDLEEMVAESHFREDLFYRLNVIQIHLPSLRERPQDIEVLIDYFLEAISSKRELAPPKLTPEAREAMLMYRWPGNIRQLRNVIERLVILRRGAEVELKHLPLPMTRGEGANKNANPEGQLPPEGVDLKDVLQRMEDNMIRQALMATNGNKNQAAKILGLNRTTLIEKLRKRRVGAA
ncbi:MAG: sigma-54-dependent Fis family transcriptional regulator [Deltaproteobacteria bacterium]|nr:sigma-54-dependent Fis family transcriptional regulator [Deltaproteobacteria bacterium]